MIKVKVDMTGWKMCEHGVPGSRLTVVRQAEDYISPSGSRRSMWLCECSCEEHNTVVVDGTSLKNGDTLSCGCYSKEAARKRCMENNHKLFKKYNAYSGVISDGHGEYYIGYCSNTNKEFYVDVEDFDKIKEYCWYERRAQSTTKIEARVGDKVLYMHTLLGFKNYDHADRNELNNRRYNLRPCTMQENSRNRSLSSKNTSGFIGVRYRKKLDKWESYINISGKYIFLGAFLDKTDAIKARLEAEAKYYGEFAPQRHLFEEYGIDTTPQND